MNKSCIIVELIKDNLKNYFKPKKQVFQTKKEMKEVIAKRRNDKSK